MGPTILRLLAAWDAARERPAWRVGGVAVGLALAAGILAAPLPDGLSEEGRRALAVTVVMGLWWLGGVLPMTVTAMLPLIAYPALGVLDAKAAAAPYANPLNFLMLGGFVLAYAMEHVGLHRRLVVALLSPAWVRRDPRRVALALMVATAVCSAFVSNTATTVMMVPIALLLAEHVQRAHPVTGAKTRAAFVLSTAYAASIGGVATLVGTAPNAALAGIASSTLGREVGFLRWMMVGVPFVVLSLPVAWFVVNRVTLPVPGPDGSLLPAPLAAERRPGQGIVLGVLLACMAGWLFRVPIDVGLFVVPGWGSLVPAKIDDSFVAMAGAIALFLFPRPGGAADPAELALDDDASEHRFLLSWRKTARALPWSVLILLGGGFAMAEAITKSGLGQWVARGFAGMETLPAFAAAAALCLGVAFVSAFTSNAATTQMVLPLLAAAAPTAGIDPLVWMVPATMSASCDFTLAVGTPPNAIAAEQGGVSPGDMAASGILLNFACALLAAAIAVLLGPIAFPSAP